MKATITQQNHATSRTWRSATRLSALAASVLLAVSASAQTVTFTNVWSITNDAFADLPSLNTANNVRGLALSPITTNVLYASTVGGPHFSTLDFADGYNKLGQGSGSGISLGTLSLTQIRVADDGSVYACNLSGGSNSVFKIYKWPSDTDFSTAPEVVYNSSLQFTTPPVSSFQWRIGDQMDLRGSGESTEIVAVGNGSGGAITTNFVIFRPTDAFATNFTNFTITIPGGSASVNPCGAGVTFEGTNDVLYVKQAGATTIRRVVYNPATLTAVVTNTYAADAAANNGIKYFEAGGVRMLATGASGTPTNSATHRAKVLQLVGASNAVVVLNDPLPSPYGSNINAIAMVDVKQGHLAFSAVNNGISLYRISGIVFTNPPSVGTISGGGAYVGGYPVTLSATANGPEPLSYQWYFNTNTPISGATTNTYSIASVQVADAGIYSLVVSNPYGVATSSFAGLSVVPGTFTGFATNLWTLAPGSRDYLTTTDTQRGLAYDAVSNVVVLVSRSPSNAVHLLDADTGADVGTLDLSALYPPNPTPPGLNGIVVNMAGVAEDGAVYVCNLTDTNTINFTIYRWQNADPALSPTLAYQAFDGFRRVGDTLSVRGGGLDTQILCADRRGTNVFLFTTVDGSTFTPTLIAVTNLPPDAIANGFAGLGLAFGAGDTFWAKSAGFRLRKVAFNAAAGTAEVVETYDTPTDTDSALGVDVVNGYVATVAYGQNPRNISIWDVSQGPPNAVQLDRELFGSNNANVNGTGAVAVDVAGGRFFALDSSNGLIAVAYPPRVFITPEAKGGIVTWSGPGTLQSAPEVTGPWSNVTGATSPYTNNAADRIFFRVAR